MQIVCPNCAASYQVDISAIGAAGRSVRCVRCRSIWFQQPLEISPLAAAAVATREPASDTTVAAFQSELGQEPPPKPAAAPPIGEAAPPSENGDPAGPSLAALMATDQAADAPQPAEAAQAETDPPPGAALSEIAIPAGQAPPIAPADPAPPDPADKRSGDIESIAFRRGKRGTARRRMPMRAGRMLGLILVLVGVVAALIAWRGSIVRHAPQMASLYAAIGMPVNLRGLTFTDVTVSRDNRDGVPVLVVEGSIASTASQPVEVPRLRFAMRNQAGAEIYAWTAMPSKEVLAPGETLPFRSRLASPPGEGRDVTVRFFTRLDAMAGLR